MAADAEKQMMKTVEEKDHSLPLYVSAVQKGSGTFGRKPFSQELKQLDSIEPESTKARFTAVKRFCSSSRWTEVSFGEMAADAEKQTTKTVEEKDYSLPLYVSAVQKGLGSFGRKPFSRQAIGQQAFIQRTFGQKTFGQKTFCQKTYG